MCTPRRGLIHRPQWGDRAGQPEAGRLAPSTGWRRPRNVPKAADSQRDRGRWTLRKDRVGHRQVGRGREVGHLRGQPQEKALQDQAGKGRGAGLRCRVLQASLRLLGDMATPRLWQLKYGNHLVWASVLFAAASNHPLPELGPHPAGQGWGLGAGPSQEAGLQPSQGHRTPLPPPAS